MMPAEMLLMIYVAKSEAKYLCQGFLDPDIKNYYCCDAFEKPSHTIMDEFSNPKIYIARSGPLNRAFSACK